MKSFPRLSKKETAALLAASAAVVGAVIHVLARLFWGDGIFAWQFGTPQYRSMISELAALFVTLTLLGRYGRGRTRLAAMSAVCAAFLWIHVILVPLLVSGLYILYLCMAGKWIRRLLGVEEPKGFQDGRCFLLGSMGVICLFCAMSAAGIGSLPWLWGAVLASGALLAAQEIRRFAARGWRGKRERPGFAQGAWTWEFSLGMAFILTMVFLQAARMNISVDYDSLWYGVRAPYILDNGRGIYENMGSIAVVYTYSKGWETLTLPLSALPSYSFLISFNLWMAAGTLWAAFRIGCYFMERRTAFFMAVFLSAVPALMNMGITAKTDAATLFVQLLMVLEIVKCAGSGTEERSGCRERGLNFFYSLGAFLLSWTMKPTAMVFSTAVYGMGVIYLLTEKKLPCRLERKDRFHAFGIVVLAAGSLAGIWARTWMITGLPVTSVFSSLLTRLGFQMKYPFSVRGIPDGAAGLSAGGRARHLAGRLYGLLLNPQGEDMSHVILAWGGLTVLFVLAILVIWMPAEKRAAPPGRGSRVAQRGSMAAGRGGMAAERGSRAGMRGSMAGERGIRVAETRSTAAQMPGQAGRWNPDKWIRMVLLPFVMVNLASLALLNQVDGNYFILFYVLMALWGFRMADQIGKERLRLGVLGLGILVTLFSALMTTVTNWSWSLGLTPVNIINRGYFDHEEYWHTRMAEAGNGTIWNILAADPRSRVISIGSHPETLMFPCSVQSYTDITGSDGNVVLVKTMDGFVDFMRYAKTDYVYAEAGWIDQNERAWSLTCNLIEYGILRPVCYEGGNMLAEVDTQGQRTERSVAMLEEFQEKYRRKENGQVVVGCSIGLQRGSGASAVLSGGIEGFGRNRMGL